MKQFISNKYTIMCMIILGLMVCGVSLVKADEADDTPNSNLTWTLYGSDPVPVCTTELMAEGILPWFLSRAEFSTRGPGQSLKFSLAAENVKKIRIGIDAVNESIILMPNLTLEESGFIVDFIDGNHWIIKKTDDVIFSADLNATISGVGVPETGWVPPADYVQVFEFIPTCTN